MAEKFIVPASVASAAKLKDSKSAFLAGGTEINRMDSLVRAKTLISIGRLGLDCINAAEIDGREYLRVGATATFTDCILDERVPAYFKAACRFMSSSVKRNMATVGGNVAIARDDSYLIPTLVASKALVEFSNGRLLDVAGYVRDHGKYKDRLIVALWLDPYSDVRSKRYSNTAAGHAYVSVAVSSQAVAVQIKGTGLLDTSAIEASSDRSEKACLDWARSVCPRAVRSDIFGSADYKRYLAGITVAMLSGGEGTV